MQYAIVGCASH